MISDEFPTPEGAPPPEEARRPEDEAAEAAPSPEPAPEPPAESAESAASAPPPEEQPGESQPAPDEAPTDGEQPENRKHWYVVKVQSGREESIKEAIERKVKIEGLEEYFGQIFVPTEKVTEVKNGKRVTRERKVLPGYIMAEVEFNDRILYLFRETTGVGDFVGGSINRPPPPMASHEIAKWMGKKPGKEEPVVITSAFERGDRVKVKDGMFKDMEGEVKEVLEAKNQVKVELTIFGRPVLVEMEYWQVESA